MSYNYPKRFRMSKLKTTALVDCAGSGNYKECMHPVQEDGSPYEVYERTGDIKKALPLVYRPPYNKSFPVAQGRFIPRSMNSPFYRPSCDNGMLLLNGRWPRVSEEECKKMYGRVCKYPKGFTNRDSCYTDNCGRGIVKFRCPEGINNP